MSKLYASALGGAVGTTLIYPLDVLKTQLMNRSFHEANLNFSSRINIIGSDIIKRDGYIGFYRGFVPTFLGAMPEKAIKLTLNDVAREILLERKSLHNASLSRGKSNQKLDMSEEIIAAFTSGFGQLFFVVPFEQLKVQLQTQIHKPATERLPTSTLAWKILRNPYRGFGWTFLREVPFCLLFFPTFHSLKSTLKYSMNYEPEVESFSVSLLSGMIAGGTCGALVTPADLIRTRLQANNLQVASTSASTTTSVTATSSAIYAVRDIVHREGVKGLYRGWQARAGIIAPLYALAIFIKDMQKL